MVIGEREQMLLAELKNMPSFTLLMALFKEFEEDVLMELAGQKDTPGLVRISRFYQTMRTIREFLESRPEAAESNLLRIKETAYAADGLPDAEDNSLGMVREVMRSMFDPAKTVK